jgi:hypothetical protein
VDTTTTKKAQKAAKEAVDKETKEEQIKKDEEARNRDIVLMDVDISEISIVGAIGHTQFSGLSFGLDTPFSPNDVPNLRKFVCDKESGIIVQEQEKKVMETRGNPILVIK